MRHLLFTSRGLEGSLLLRLAPPDLTAHAVYQATPRCPSTSVTILFPKSPSSGGETPVYDSPPAASFAPRDRVWRLNHLDRAPWSEVPEQASTARTSPASWQTRGLEVANCSPFWRHPASRPRMANAASGPRQQAWRPGQTDRA